MFTPNQQNCSHPNQGPSHRAGNPGGNTAPARQVEASPAARVGLLARAFWHCIRWIYSIIPVPVLRRSVERSRRSPAMVRRVLSSGDTSLAEIISNRFALASFERAAARVPAYREFLRRHGVDPLHIRTIGDFDALVPKTTRQNYVQPFPIRERCVDGRLPAAGAIDESAGSTGEPYNWIRGAKELALLRDTFHMGLRFSFGYDDHRPSVLLNTFSCGAWAAGFRLGSSLETWCLVKNIGPDAERTARSLAFFGPGEHYLIAGYPPFLRELVRFLKTRAGLNLKEYRIDLMTGGEGFPPGWRSFMQTELSEGARIISAYGASDLEMGIATETPYSIAILGALCENERLRTDLLGTSREPVFLGQYNPSGHYIRGTPNDRGQTEVEITILNPCSAAPRIKYCIGDAGSVLPFERTQAVLRQHGVSIPASSIALPFLYLFGRCDGTVSIDGANVYPEMIASALMGHPMAAQDIVTFKMGIRHPESGPAKLAILLRAAEGVRPDEPLTRVCKQAILDKLLVMNTDFRESYKDNPASADPLVEVLPFDSDAFADSAGRIKNHYFF